MAAEDLDKLVEHWKEQYRHALAEKASMAAQLEEALGLLEIKDEHIALLEKKAALATDLQSQLEGSATEADSLRFKLQQGAEKLNRNNVVKNELEEELIASVDIEKKYYELRDSNAHASNELKLLQDEIRELMDINRGLLKDLEKMGQLQMQVELLQQENFELRKNTAH